MGLDCTAYSNLRAVPDPEDRDAALDDGGKIHAFAYVGFDRSTRGLVDHDKVTKIYPGSTFDVIANGWYETTDETKQFHFHAGGYIGHGLFRQTLAAMSGHVAEDFWRDGAGVDAPFYELVNFADNEGCIGPEAAADLLVDFREHRDAYFAANPDEYDQRRYDEWTFAFSLASSGGLVAFH